MDESAKRQHSSFCVTVMEYLCFTPFLMVLSKELNAKLFTRGKRVRSHSFLKSRFPYQIIPINEKSRYSQRISIFTTAIITNKLIRGIAELQLKICPIFLPFQIAISTRPYLNILKHFRDGPHCLVNLIFSTV